ncbi:unnamed protein product [Linum trigynum]|uniref:RNA helicase n=1 Tax=Linum trigynum TaxID=586398 RepID=A0AAV2E012_9ROSI
MRQRDVIGIAVIGSGKTATFVLPMLTYISRLPPMSEYNAAKGPYAVVLAPTRELAQQIKDETVKRYTVLNKCNYIVLDEADRMVDMGFEPQVMGYSMQCLSNNLKPENEDKELDEKKIYRTTYMSSATMPPAVERLARKYLRNPVLVTIDVVGRGIDIPDVAHVINYDMMGSIKGVHSSSSSDSDCYTFLTFLDTNVFYDFKKMLVQSNSVVPPELAKHEASKFKYGSNPYRPLRRNNPIFTH